MTQIQHSSWRDSNPYTIRVKASVTNQLPRRLYSDPIIEDPSQEFERHSLADMDPRANNPIDIELAGDVFTVLRGDEVLPNAMGLRFCRISKPDHKYGITYHITGSEKFCTVLNATV